jgi:hypothetical protein
MGYDTATYGDAVAMISAIPMAILFEKTKLNECSSSSVLIMLRSWENLFSKIPGGVLLKRLRGAGISVRIAC